MSPRKTLQISSSPVYLTTSGAPQDDLFRHRLDNILSLKQSWRLAGRNSLLGEYYEEAVVGEPPKPTRLMAGLLYLKHTFALSDEALIDRWVENAYWQYFYGETYFHSSMSRRSIRPA